MDWLIDARNFGLLLRDADAYTSYKSKESDRVIRNLDEIKNIISNINHILRIIQRIK